MIDRDTFNSHWNLYVRNEEYIRITCRPNKYRLLWTIREYLESNFDIDFDGVSSKSDYLKSLLLNPAPIYDISNKFDQYSRNKLSSEQRTLILGGLFYIIVFGNVTLDGLPTFRRAIFLGLKKVANSEIEYTDADYANKRKMQEITINRLLEEFEASLYATDDFLNSFPELDLSKLDSQNNSGLSNDGSDFNLEA